MRRLLLVLIILLLGLGITFFIGANFFLDLASRQLLKHVPDYSSRVGIMVLTPSFEAARFSSLRGMSWSGAKASLRPRFKGEFTAKKYFDVQAGSFNIEALDWSFDVFRISGSKLNVKYTRGATAALLDQEEPLGGGLEVGKIEADGCAALIRIDLREPAGGIKEVIRQVKELLSNGRTAAALSFTGRYTMLIDNRTEHWVGIEVKQKDEQSVLALNRADLEGLRSYFKKLTDGELSLMERNPHWASAMVKIKKDAENFAKEKWEADSAVPENVYEHAMWSYTLTEQFGARFAKEVTDSNQTAYRAGEEKNRALETAASAEGRRYAVAKLGQPALFEEIKHWAALKFKKSAAVVKVK